MAEPPVQRRLAAILAADVVGYSRLVEADEAGTLAALRQRRKAILEPAVALHHGRVIKVMGDGVLVEFGSAVNAVASAVELQKLFATANAGMAEDRRIVLRVGVNLGDVVVEGGDLYGDGVIIAVRLQEMTEPGGICISGAVHEQVAGKLSAVFDDLGPREVKNSAKPVRVYRLRTGTEPTPARPTLAHPDKPSVAVLPFTNMSGDPAQEYYSDGITEDIITELSRFHSLLVIARNSSFQYRAAADVKRIARELGVQYVVEGSVRRSAGRVRITAQLIEAATGNHLWAERYDREMQDIFAVQDEVTQSIAATVEGRMAAGGAQRSRRKPTNDLAAYDCFLQGRESIERRGDQAAAALRLRRAIELDPGFAQAHAWLARVLTLMYHHDLRPETLQGALALGQKAISLDDADAWSHAVAGYAYTIGGQHDLAGLHLDRAVALNPMDVRITSTRSLWLAYTGRGDEAVQNLDTDLQRDPFPPAWFWDYRAIALFQARRYEEAVQALSHLTTLYHWDRYYLAASYAHLGRIEQARACVAEILRTRPGFELSHVELTEPFKDKADLENLLDGLRKAGIPE